MPSQRDSISDTFEMTSESSPITTQCKPVFSVSQGVQAYDRVARSTLKLKLSTALASIASIALMCLAGTQSYLQFVTFGYAPRVTDNHTIAVINAVVAVYGAITGMSTRYAVTKCLELITIKALSKEGKFGLSAKTWAYMAHANGPFYLIGPLFLAGLAGTAVISVLPATVVDNGHFVDFNVSVDWANETSCMKGQSLQPNPYCTGAVTGVLLMQSYTHTQGFGYAQRLGGAQIAFEKVISSRSSLGYPWNLVTDRDQEFAKYNITTVPGRTPDYRESNKTSCVWTLSSVPLRCAWANITPAAHGELAVASPYSQQIYHFYNQTTCSSGVPQGIITTPLGDVTEMAGIGLFGDVTEDPETPKHAFVCSSRDPAEVHHGQYITSLWTGPDTGVLLDVANSSTCQPAYQLPSPDIISAIFNDMAGGIYQFASVDGFNSLMQAMEQGNWVKGSPMFDDSTSQLEDSMGAFMSLMLSQIYSVTSANEASSSSTYTRVDGGVMRTSVGLGKHSRFYAWMILALVPLATLIIALAIPRDYLPAWDTMNIMDAFATTAVLDEEFAARRGRCSNLRLGLLDGRVVASNMNLPVRMSKADMML